MIDIHSHILYGLDDGAQTLADSVAMLEMAAAAGTTDIVATPHADLKFRFQPELNRQRQAEVQAAAGSKLRVHLGCDFHLSSDNIEDALANPAKYTVNGRNYLLVEFSDLLIPKTTGEVFASLLGAGMVPIITHPERNWLLTLRLAEIEAWIGQGALVQVTSQSLGGLFGSKARKFAEELMRRDLVHFIASDAHSIAERNPRLDEAFAMIAGRYGKNRAERLLQVNPKCVIEGRPLPAVEPEAIAPERKWYQVWRRG
ncbi:MAG: exopolysaccharide biosynthesis protein [Acidobacteria bacterium]|nr:exopolysaccharide biosynthesis protein [Acidobacteriota bacterium]